MSKQLAPTLEQSLKTYQAFIEDFEPGSGDTFIALGAREYLQAKDLTESQRQRMAETDGRVLSLSDVQYEDDADDDVSILRMIADVIRGSSDDKKAA